MRTCLDCIPCFIRQALEAARFVTEDPSLHESVVRSVLQETAEMDFSCPPPVVAQKLHRRLRHLSGNPDPYREVKSRFNALAMEMIAELRIEIEKSEDPLYLALRLAIAGNVIDLGIKGGISEGEIRSSIGNTLREPFHGDIHEFRKAVNNARNILYLSDNAGEIAFDRLLIERMPASRITLAVRGAPVLNDATCMDADEVGLSGQVPIISNGSDAPGPILSDCSEDFRSHYNAADLIISKGQGNFETLSDENANIYFLFKVKCPPVSADVGVPVGTHMALYKSRRMPQCT